MKGKIMWEKNYFLTNKKKHCKLNKILIVLFLSSSFCTCTDSSSGHSPSIPPGPDISVWPDAIKFNYEDGNSSDAITIRKADGTAATGPEWICNSVNERFAYIKDQSNLKIQVRFDSNCENMNLLINVNVVSGTGIGNISDFSIENYTRLNWVTLPVNGSIPNTVDINNFIWKWYIYAIPSDVAYSSAMSTVNSDHTFYTLVDVPQEPMTEPWTSVLDYACNLASGQSTVSGVAQKIVEGLYNQSGFKYDVELGLPRYTNWTDGSFDLTTMLSEFGSNNIIVNCYDMGKAVNIFANALGCNSDYTLSSPFGYLNCIKPIGRDWANNPFYASMESPYNVPIVGEDDAGRSKFANHAFCMIDNDIYDACLTVDIDINPDAAPHTESWATGWIWDDYKSRVIDDNPASNPYIPVIYTYSVD
jgi:hypothetical protein